MGRTVEDLTVVVLTHDLAHACAQLGADIEGRRWPAAEFAMAETALKEGLAQYYTHRVLNRLKERYRGALEAYRAMPPRQPPAYRTHLPWVKGGSPEAVVPSPLPPCHKERSCQRGFTRPNLFRMRHFFDACQGDEKVSALLRQSPWTHHLLILGQAKLPE